MNNGLQSPVFGIDRYSYSSKKMEVKDGQSVRWVKMGFDENSVYSIGFWDECRKKICRWAEEDGEDVDQKVPEGHSVVGVYGDTDETGIFNLGFITIQQN